MTLKTTTQSKFPIEIFEDKGLAKSLEAWVLNPLFETVPELKLLFSKDSRSVLKGRIQSDPQFRKELANTFDMFALLLKNSNCLEDLQKNISVLKQSIHDLFDDNMRIVYDQLKEIKQSLYSLKLCFENAETGAKIKVLPVDKNAFIESQDDIYWAVLKKRVEKQFKDWNMQNCPAYLSFTFPIESPATARKIAKFMSRVLGIAQLDIPPFKSSEDVLLFMDNSFSIANANDELAHLMIAGTHGYLKEVYEDYDQTRLLMIPLSPALTGKMLSVPIGDYFTSLKGSPIIGIESVVCEYNYARDDSHDFHERGLIQIIDSGHVQGTATCCNGDISEYNSFLQMDIFIMVMRSLIHQSNQNAHGKWGEREQEKFINGLISYFNGLFDDTDGNRVIEEPVTKEMIGIYYDEKRQTVYVTIPIKYAGVARKFRFTLKGNNDSLEQMKKRPA